MRLFTELILRAYVAKVDQHVAAAKMTFRGEIVDDEYAVVRTTIPLSFDDNRALGEKETGGRTALLFPREIEAGIDRYLGARGPRSNRRGGVRPLESGHEEHGGPPDRLPRARLG